MLVTMQEESWLAACDVAAKGLEALMGFVAARVVMDVPGRVVGHKHIHRWEAQESTLDFLLLVEMVAAQLVTLAPTEAAETQAVKFPGL